jgi:DegV family protein with EDD domain
MTHLVVDSGCDVTPAVIEGEGLTLTHVPLNLQLEDKLYLDDEHLNIDEYIAHMERSPVGVKSSAPSPGLFFDRFKIGDSVFAVTLSSKLSATYESAMNAKRMYLEECEKKFIHVFDSLTAAIGEGVIAMKIADLVKKGVGNLEVVDQVNDFIGNMKTFFILDRYDNLVKTGRIKPYIAKIASFLNVKPICCANEGEIKMVDKARGYTKAMKRMVELIRVNTPDIENRIIGITHVKCYEKAVALKDEIMKTLRAKDIIIQECRGVTATYANQGGVVVAL